MLPALQHPSDQEQIEDLEYQLRQLSNTAAQAIDRVAELELELAAANAWRSPSSMSTSSSVSSLGSLSSDELRPNERLQALETAVMAIKRARSELFAPHNFQYL